MSIRLFVDGLFSALKAGFVPPSGGSASDVLHADGTWGPVVTGSAFFDTVITPAALPNAVTDNYNPGTLGQNTLIRVSAAPATNPRVSGLVGGVSGKIVAFLNINAGGVIIKMQSEVLTSTAANRFTNAASADLPTDTRSCVIYYYDGITSRWVSIATAKI